MQSLLNTPIADNSRIQHLDILRGLALLGILIMNIQSFSMPIAAYLNPTSWGDLEGVNFLVWLFSHVLADQKFMSLFSILFGAGICLFAERAEKKNNRSAWLHYKRNFWLLIFGLIHAYFIWFGDILVSYALCAFWVYWFRNRSPTTLFVLSVIFISIGWLHYLLVNFLLNAGYIPENEIQEILAYWQPTNNQLLAEVSAYQGGFSQQQEFRVTHAFFLQTQIFVLAFRIGGMMMLGMALYKSGILIGKKSSSYYLGLAIIGLVLGLGLSSYGVSQNIANEFSFHYSMFLGYQYNYWGSVFTALSYLGLVNLIIQKNLLQAIQNRLASVGKMAFTNYILQSIVCTFIFYGHGFGLFSEVDRIYQIAIVVAVWILQLYLSPWWLEKFKFGPLEWAWRSLTYWEKQPLRKQ